MKEKSICIHGGTHYDSNTKGVNTPIYTSTCYGYIDEESQQYPRYFSTVNQNVVAKKLALLENTETGLVFSSGMAAISTTLFAFLKKGDHVVFQKGLYGGTINFIISKFNQFGIEYSFVTDNNIDNYECLIKKNTKLIYIETPSNPLLEIVDVKEIAKLAKARKIISVIDNTFATPINQKPYDLGIDIVLHSGTKYLGGHSDLSAGAALLSNKKFEILLDSARMFGGNLDSVACYLLERSLKTLSIRMDAINKNALNLAKWLEDELKYKVYYPGLVSNSGYEVSKRQMSGFSGMLSFELSKTDPYEFQKKLKLIKATPSLGGVDTTICSPAITSHKYVSIETRMENGITDNLLRVSIGIEDTEDLKEDILQALR